MRPVIAQEDLEYLEWLKTEYVPISGGDDSEDTSGGSGTGQQEGSGDTGDAGAGEGNTQGHDPNEPKDEKGVPLKNRLEEERRKREKAERQLAEEKAAARARQEEWERQQAQARKPDGSSEPEEDLDSLAITDPARYRDLVAQEAAKKASESVRREIAERERAKDAQATFERLKDQFDELADADSEFYQEVDREYTERLRRYGLQFDARTLEDVVHLIAYRKQKKPVQRSSERPPVGETGHPRDTGSRNTKITDGSKRVAKALGFSEKRLAAAFSRDLSGEIGTGTRG